MKILSKIFVTILSLTLVGGLTISCKKDKPNDPDKRVQPKPDKPVNPPNGGDEPEVKLNVDGTELPCLFFGMDQQAKPIVEHERSVGRVEKDLFHLPEFGGFPLSLYQNPTLSTIPIVMYAVQDRLTKFLKTLSFCKEEVNNCPNLIAMMKKAGFPASKLQGDDRIWSARSQGFSIKVVMKRFDPGKYEKDYEPYKVKSLVTFVRIPSETQYSGKFIHELLVDAKDLPPHAVINQTLSKIHNYEISLGMRDSIGMDTRGVAVNYKTKTGWLNRSNIYYIDYFFNLRGTKPFIEMELNCLKNIDDIKTTDFVSWFANNGYHLTKDDKGEYWTVLNYNDKREYIAQCEEGYTISIRTFRLSNKILLQILPTEEKDHPKKK